MTSTYGALFLGQARLLGAKELWKSKAPNKCHFFVWFCPAGLLLDSSEATQAWLAERRDLCSMLSRLGDL
jgi:hypothetical protein